VQAGALRRGTGETIRAALLSADLRDFTRSPWPPSPRPWIPALDAWFDRVARAVHAFGGEVMKFIGDGVLAIFRVTGAPAEACAARCRCRPRRDGPSRCGAAGAGAAAAALWRGAASGQDIVGQYRRGRPAGLTAIGPAVNLVSRLEGLCRPLGRSVLISGALAAETTAPLVPLGEHVLHGIAAPCAVFTLPDG
jgi:adenylate cyclase